MQLDLHTPPKDDFDDTRRGQPLTVVCVDGSEESDRALRFAMRNLPKNHGLLLVHGVKINYSASIEIHPKKDANIREHNDMADRYRSLCKDSGRRCAMTQVHFQRGDAFGDAVCSYARLRGAEGVITGRRRNVSDLRRATWGSGSSYIMDHCGDIPVTVVNTDSRV